jgi:succinoglycan biosynthesis protein ExoA
MAAQYSPRDSLRGLFLQYWRFGFFRVRTTARHPDALRLAHLGSVGSAAVVAALAVPRSRRPAALACLVYVALIAASVRRLADLPARERAGVGAALSTMHVGWGAGFLAGCLRHGPPLGALARAAWRGVSRG